MTLYPSKEVLLAESTIDPSEFPLADDQPQPLLSAELYVAIAADASFKVGTCEHCVLLEPGRPERAWDAIGDTDLDFDRDRYFALLAHLGIMLHERCAYVCP